MYAFCCAHGYASIILCISFFVCVCGETAIKHDLHVATYTVPASFNTMYTQQHAQQEQFDIPVIVVRSTSLNEILLHNHLFSSCTHIVVLIYFNNSGHNSPLLPSYKQPTGLLPSPLMWISHCAPFSHLVPSL